MRSATAGREQRVDCDSGYGMYTGDGLHVPMRFGQGKRKCAGLKALPEIADQAAAWSAIGKCFSFLHLSHFLAENRYPLFREML